MAHENNAEALGLEFAEHEEEMFYLARVEAGGGFVEDEHFRFNIEGACNGDHLLNGEGITVQRLRDIHADVQSFERIGGAQSDLFPVDTAQLHRLAAEKNVLRH